MRKLVQLETLRWVPIHELRKLYCAVYQGWRLSGPKEIWDEFIIKRQLRLIAEAAEMSEREEFTIRRMINKQICYWLHQLSRVSKHPRRY